MTKTNPGDSDHIPAGLPQAARDVLAQLARLARQQSLSAYLVGGPVRDLLLGRPSLDLDVSVEGDAEPLVSGLEDAFGLRAVRHAAFLTATIRAEDVTLDIATARRETYERPGALPKVQAASIQDDLARRDFSINAIALALTGERAGEYIDPAKGRSDLNSGLVRVLHERSFVDDATRILRAARYETRFGFTLEPETEGLLRRDVAYLQTISGARLRHELQRILAEEQPEAALLRLHGLGALQAIHPALSFSDEPARWFSTAREIEAQLPGAYWALLFWEAGEDGARALAARLSLTRAQEQIVTPLPGLRELATGLEAPDLRPSEVTEMLDAFPPAAVWALAAASGGIVAERCLEYLRRGRGIRTLLRGDDIIAMGVPPGPAVGEVLRRLRVAKLDGALRSKEDEVRLAESLLEAKEYD